MKCQDESKITKENNNPCSFLPLAIFLIEYNLKIKYLRNLTEKSSFVNIVKKKKNRKL